MYVCVYIYIYIYDISSLRVNKSGIWSIYNINYMFRPLHWPSPGLHLTYQETIQSLPPPDPQYIIQIVSSLDKLNANLIMASVEAETCS